MKASDLIDFTNCSINWEAVELVPEFAALKNCEQNPKWHSEGDSMTHTMKVCDVVIDMIRNWRGSGMIPNWSRSGLPVEDADVLLTAALFHDIGKGVTTKIGKDGNWHSYGHEFEGEKITRRLLWDEDLSFREKVCALVKYHMLPLNIIKHKNYIEEIVRLSCQVNLLQLYRLKYADCMGSEHSSEIKCDEMRILNHFSKLVDFLKLSEPKPYFCNKYLFNLNDYELNIKKPSVNLFMMIGLPGSGKNTLIDDLFDDNKIITLYDGDEFLYRFQEGETEILSRDDIRAELGFCADGQKIVGTKEQEDKVTEIFNQRMLHAASCGHDIVINNINLKKKYREEIVNTLSKEYNVITDYLYVEAKGIEKNIERRKNDGFSKETFEKMIENFDWPDFFECGNNLHIFRN